MPTFSFFLFFLSVPVLPSCPIVCGGAIEKTLVSLPSGVLSLLHLSDHLDDNYILHIYSFLAIYYLTIDTNIKDHLFYIYLYDFLFILLTFFALFT